MTHPRRLVVSLLAAALVILALSSTGARPASAATGSWTGKFYNNTTLSGTAVATVNNVAQLNFGYDVYDGVQAPAPGVNPTNFSTSWTRTDTWAAGTYRFTATSDDGVRVYVDGLRIIDQWVEQGATTFFADRVLTAGSHTIKVEYYNGTNGGTLQFGVVDASTVAQGWSGQYFANMTLSGSPAFARNDGAEINFQWNLSSPQIAGITSGGPTLPVDGFSIRWTQTLTFNEGVYTFSTTSDDGSRVFIDGQLVVNAWQDQAAVTISANKQMTAGQHTVVVEYYENAGGASMQFTLTYRPDLGGFVTDTVGSGFDLPTAFAFAPDGRILVAQKDGAVRVIKNGAVLASPFYTVSPLNNFQDRGLIGIAIDPNFASNGYVYLAYTYDVDPTTIDGAKTNQIIRITANGDVADPASKLVLLGTDTGTAASPTCDFAVSGVNRQGVWTTTTPHRLSVGDSIVLPQPIANAAPAIPAGTYTVSSTPSSTTLTVSQVASLTTAGTASTPPTTFYRLNADCLPSDGKSHSVGALKFGPDGMLYAAVGDAASYNNVDPLALRAQDINRFSGKILRINPANGQGLPDNPFYDGNVNDTRSKVWAYGVRNDFRFNFKPGTRILYAGDVGWDTWEEVNVIPANGGSNLGWPCYEGNPPQGGYAAFSLCQSLYNAGGTTFGIYTYNHDAGSAAVAGGAFTGDATTTPANTYKSAFQNAYWFADYPRNEINVFKVDANDQMVPGSLTNFTTSGDGPVDVEVGPQDGDIYYLSIITGQVRRIRFIGDNRPPVAVAAASPTNGLAPLNVTFSSAGSGDPDAGQAITYDWNFGDGSPNSGAANPPHQYAANGVYTATLTVTDPFFVTATSTVTITVGNTAPTPSITSPVDGSRYDVGDTLTFAGGATDAQDGAIPASGLSWTVILQHCSDATFTSCHPHTVLDRVVEAGGSLLVDDHGDFTYFQFRLQATDSGGLQASTSVSVTPNRVAISFASSPPGATISVDGTTQSAPFTRSVPRKSAHVLYAADPQTIGGNALTFGTWSDGGANPHTITAGADATYTVTLGPPATPTPTAGSTATPTPTGTVATATATATGTPRPSCYDFNGDGSEDSLDLGLLAGRFLTTTSDPGFDPKFDLDSDGGIDGIDLGIFASRFLARC
ncbi:MAG: PQQ-dependent sugar dehydrogenase [Dehalococcoidia bacterium]|nr:PQQ-dependent sugar dehydrogenase [Dehalococcoidia bacterium]